ncbi:MAG: S24 family peptidase [Muribaculaceae bacterium]|nr:S24 family peptidase [Muribaculaceae bacterium]
MDISHRLKKAVDYLKLKEIIATLKDVAVHLDRNPANVIKAINGDKRYLTKPFIADFATVYSDYINEDWLLMGKGEMEADAIPMRPHLETTVAAGSMVGISEGEYGDNLKEIIPGIPDYDFTITADGSSMEPRIESGDILACRIVRDPLNPPLGKVCVIDSKDGWVVKVIKEVKEDYMVLHSINPKYKDYSVDFSAILNIAIVVGMIRVFD